MSARGEGEAEFKYELFFELSPDLLCIAGFDGYFKKVNQAVIDLFGYTEEEIYTRPINDFVYEDDRNITSMVRKELTRSKPLMYFENRYVTKNGELVWLHWTSLPLENEKQVFAIAKNITHKKKLEAERNAHLVDLTNANKELKQLTYTASHDLRSPVNNLLAVFNMMDTSKISDGETQELIGILKAAGEQLKSRLNNYVDVLSDKYQQQAKLESVDLSECLSDVRHSVSTLIISSKTTIKADFTRHPVVNFNRTYLESVFLNLITNSIKYARPEVPAIISIHSETKNGAGQLVFSDNGLGFNMEEARDKIFGLHQKFHHHSDSKGVGLYLVYNHITNLGGQINVESEPNKGTTFTILFKQ